MHDDATIITIDGDLFVSFNGELRPIPRGGADDVTPPPAAAETPEEQPEEVPPAEGEVAEEQVEEIPDLPPDIEAVDEDALYSLHEQLTTQLSSRRESAKTPADVQAVQSIADRMNAISGELERRRAEAQEVADQLTALDQSLPQALPERTPQPAMAGAGATAAQLAAARNPQAAGAQTPPAPRPARPRVALLAGAGASNVPAGAEMDWSQLGQAFDQAKTRGRGDTILASFPAYTNGDPDIPELLSTDNGAARNAALIDEAVADWRERQRGEQPSRQGAICEPFDIIRDIPDAFSTSEPVSGVFPSRPASRLGFQFVRSIGLADVDGGAGMWFDEDQEAVDPDNSETWKPCVEVVCPDIETATAEAVTACLTFDITTEMSAPERVRNYTNALMALKARVKEGRVLQRIDALSHAYQFFGDYGALPAVIEAINTVLAQLTFADRLEDTNYVLIVPPGVQEILTIDRANRAYGVESETSDVMAYLRGNVEGVSSIVSSLDSSRGGEPSLPFAALTPITDPPSAVTVPYISGGNYRFRLVEPAAAIYAETGEMNVGTTRDARLIRMNKTQYFTEEFFFLAKHGPQPWATIDINLCADGSRAGLVEPAHCDVS